MFIECDAENYKRKNRLEADEVTPDTIKITDYTAKYHRTVALAMFIQKLKSLTKIAERDPSKFLKKPRLSKPEHERMQKQTQVIESLKKGKSFVFEKLH